MPTDHETELPIEGYTELHPADDVDREDLDDGTLAYRNDTGRLYLVPRP